MYPQLASSVIVLLLMIILIVPTARKCCYCFIINDYFDSTHSSQVLFSISQKLVQHQIPNFTEILKWLRNIMVCIVRGFCRLRKILLKKRILFKIKSSIEYIKFFSKMIPFRIKFFKKKEGFIEYI